MLSRWQSTIVDARGNVQPGAVLTIRNESDQSLATVYMSPSESQPYPLGQVPADASGYAYFYAPGGLYRITSAPLGIDWRHVPLGTAQAVDFEDIEEVVTRAEAEATRAEAARDAAFVNADVYPDVATGRAAVANGEQFQVVEGDEIVRYRRDSASAQTEMARYPSAEGVNSRVKLDAGNPLAIFTDADERPYAMFDAGAGLHLAGLPSSVQKMLTEEDGVELDAESPLLVELKDALGALFGVVTKDGTLHVKDLATPAGSVNQLALKAEAAISRPPLYDAFMFSDGARTAPDEERNVQHVLMDESEVTWGDFREVFGPAICRIGKNEYYLTADARRAGDYRPIQIVGRSVTFNPADRTFTLGALQILAENGEEADGTPFSFLNSTLTYVESGQNKGRIYCHFNYMTNPVGEEERTFSPYYVYSDDGGATFTAPINMGSQFPMSDWKRLNFGPGHGIQIRHGKYAGRLVFPAYRASPLYPTINDWHAVAILSDDGGDTFYVGADIDFTGLNEWQLAEDWKGDLVGVFRIYSGRYQKYIGRSADGAESFSEPTLIPEIFGAGTKVGLTQCANKFDFSAPKLIAVCAQQGIDPQSVERINPTAWMSYDGGRTWPYKYQVAGGVCEYTECISIDEDSVLVIYGGTGTGRGTQILAHDISIKNLLESQQ